MINPMGESKRRLIVVGSRLRGYREYAMASLADRYELALVTAQEPTWEQAYLVTHRIADTTDAEALCEAVADLLRDAPGSAIYTWDEWSLTATAEVAARLGLRHLSPVAAAACRDKYATRAALDAAGLPSVRHRLAGSLDEARAAADEIGYPVVLKPRALGGSLGVLVVDHVDALPAAYRVTTSAALPGVPVEPGVLVEEYLDGPELSVDSVVVDGVAEPVVVARKRLGPEPTFEELGHLVGPWRHEPWAEAVRELVQAAHRALGVEVGTTHAELRLTAGGPRLIELNGRLGGDLIPRLGALAAGIDLPALGAALAFGERPDLTGTAERWAEIRFLYPPYDGVLERLEMTAAVNVPGIAEVVQLAAPGDELLLPPRSLTPRTAALIAVADNPAGCTVALDRAEGTVRTIMRGDPLDGLGAVVENPVTRRFLARERGWSRMVVDGVRGVDWFRYGAGGGEALNRPVLLSEAERETLEGDLNGIFDLLTTIPDRIFDGDRRAFATAVGMSPTQTEIVLRGAGPHLPPLARADMYKEPGGFRLMELNTGASLGGWQMGEFTREMLLDPQFRAFVDSERLTCAEPLAAIKSVMLQECPGLDMTSRPVLAITDWPDGFAKGKCWLDFVVPGWMRIGFDPIVCHLGEFEYRDGVPYVHGRKIDVVYRIFLPGEMADEQRSFDLVYPLLDAVERGHTYLFAGLDCELFGNKGSLAMLSDERNRRLFSVDELALIDRVLPWTRFLREEKVHHAGELVDLVPYVLANKDRLALKPTIMYGGVGVVPGWTVSQVEWERHIRASLGGPYVVQERVVPFAERFARRDGTPGYEELVVAYGVMVVGRRYSGMLVRGIADPGVGIVSMSNGAQIGCAFHVEDRR